MTYFLLEVTFINSRFEFFRLYLGQKLGSEFIPYVYGILLIALFPTMQDQILKKQVAGEVKTSPFVKGYTKIAFKKSHLFA